MKAKIGVRLLDSIEARERPFHIHDEDLPGFILRVQPSGSMSYYFDFRVHGGPKQRIKIGKVCSITPAQARDRAKEIAADVTKGSDPREAKRASKEPTLEEFLRESYGPWAEVNLKSGADCIRRIKRQFQPLLQRQLSAIDTWSIEKWRSQRLKDSISKYTINRDLTALKGLLSRAVEWRVLEESPLRRVKLYRVDDQGRVRYLSEPEEIRLREALAAREADIRAGRDRGNHWRLERSYELYPIFPPDAFVDHLMPVVILSLNTGLRRGEILNLKLSEIDLNKRVLTVVGYKAKSGKTRHVPLNVEAHAVLDRWLKFRRDQSEYVFPSKDGGPMRDLKRAWAKVLTRAGITNMRFHDTRHTFGSNLAMNGVPLNTVRDLLGHADIKMTLRYAHLSPSATAAAVDTLRVPSATASSPASSAGSPSREVSGNRSRLQ